MSRLMIVVAILAMAVAAQGQQPSNVLGTCLADHTSGRDRKDLAKWIFLTLAAHPEIKQYATANASTAADESARTIAALITRLLTDSCLDETKAVIKGEGATSIKVAFEFLGQLAMQELMGDKSVTESFGLFERYLDKKRLDEALAAK